jgi:hypothetical protein
MTRRAVATLLLVGLTSPFDASAHCDTTQGPVVSAARGALDASDVNLIQAVLLMRRRQRVAA